MLFMFWVILLLHVVAAEVTLQIQPQGSVNSSITVRWERKRNDPAFWDLRFSDQAKGLDLDIGLVAATVNVEAGAKRGNVSVVFPKAGQFILKAVQAPSVVVGRSGKIVIDNPPTLTPSNTSEPSATPPPSSSDTSAPSSTASPTAGTNSDDSSTVTAMTSAGSSKPFSRTPIIVGAVVGGIALLSLIGLFMIWFIRRRRRHQREVARRLTFHRDLMVQRREAPRIPLPPLPTSSYDLEAALASEDPFVRPGSSASGGSTQTTRQLDIELRITKLQAQILELGNQPAYAAAIEQMRRQVEWLQGQEGSAWALGLTDVRPRNYDMYMTH